MKIDPSKKYRTFDLQQVTRLRPNRNPYYPWIGDVGGVDRTWTDEGKYLRGETHPFDLIEVPEPLVPLGPNEMRDGTKCRVVCNDAPGKQPVVMVFPDGSLGTRCRDGSLFGNGTESQKDLVGHLPPKPRVAWVNFYQNGVARWHDRMDEAVVNASINAIATAVRVELPQP